jgi:hypothetical protein
MVAKTVLGMVEGGVVVGIQAINWFGVHNEEEEE